MAPYLSKHSSSAGTKWALNGRFLDDDFLLESLLRLPRSEMMDLLAGITSDSLANREFLAPIDRAQEIWASGVTYLRSRDARMSESSVGDIYDRVYDAERPELFFKTLGWRSVSSGNFIRIRGDSSWNVPEPELVLILNSSKEVVGYTAGNDVSSRAIEGENPLYLPQAKSYDGSCSIGPRIILCGVEEMADLKISLQIFREDKSIFTGETNTSKMKRNFADLAEYLFSELAFPAGVFLMTGTGIIPDDSFNLVPKDLVVINVGELELRNIVA